MGFVRKEDEVHPHPCVPFLITHTVLRYNEIMDASESETWNHGEMYWPMG